MTAVLVLALALQAPEVPATFDYNYHADTLIANGVYPPGAVHVGYAKGARGMLEELFERFEADSMEWVGCFYGEFDSKTLIVTITHYREPRQLRRTAVSAVPDICSGRALGRLHPHLRLPGEDNTCFWSMPDKISFKSSISSQGYPYLFEAIMCWDGTQNVINFYGWNELRAFEEEHANIPFKFGADLTSYFRSRERFHCEN